MKRNKMNNESCYCKAGHWHQSRGEAAYCDDVHLRIKAGEIEVEFQKTFPLDLIHPHTGRKIHIVNHRPDFFMTCPKTGRQWVEEYKGARTEDWRIRQALWQICYPDIEYITINHRSAKGRFAGWSKKSVGRLRKRIREG